MLSSLDPWLAPAPDPARVAWLRGAVYAHRGLHGPGAVENSPTAFGAAIEAGLGIECDVQESGDGQAVVFHDRELDRLTGESGAVAAWSARELAQVVLRGSGDTIPPLGALLERVAARVPLLIEAKTVRERPVETLCRAIRRELEEYSGAVAVMGFDPRVCRWFRRNAPGVVRGLVLSEARAGTVERQLGLWRAGPDFLAYDVRDLPSRFAAAQRARGLPLLTWTVANADLAARAGIFADAAIAEHEGVASARVTS